MTIVLMVMVMVIALMLVLVLMVLMLMLMLMVLVLLALMVVLLVLMVVLMVLMLMPILVDPGQLGTLLGGLETCDICPALSSSHRGRVGLLMNFHQLTPKTHITYLHAEQQLTATCSNTSGVLTKNLCAVEQEGC